MKNWYGWLVAFLAAVCVLTLAFLPVTVQAAETVASGTCGEDLTWSLDSKGTLTISGTGEMYDEYGWHINNGELPPWSAYKESIRKVIVTEGVTTIGANAFYEYTALETVSLPDSLLEIRECAFWGCTALSQINIPHNMDIIEMWAFKGCESLMEIYLPEGVSLGSCVFLDCKSLKEINIPKSWTYIPSWFLSGCSNIKEVELHEGITEIGSSAFESTGITSISFPDTLTSIGNSAFGGTNLKKVEIPESVEIVESSAFWNCDQLVSVVIRSEDTEFENFVFCYCDSLTSVSLPEGMTKIYGAMFDGCVSLESITLPQSITSIEPQAFMNCEKLKQINIPDGVLQLEKNAFRGCASLEQIKLPDGLISIGDAAFAECSALKEITIPNTVTSIGIAAFDGCAALTEIIIPDSVTSIGSYAFYECTGLLKVKLPDHLEIIEEQTFAFCMNLEDINMPKQMKEVGENAFKGVILTELILPEGLETIGKGAFYACLMDYVYIPNTVKTIGYMAFDGNSIWHVLYGGTETQWDEIVIEESNLKLQQAYRHYNAVGDEITDVEKMICKHCGSVCAHKWDDGTVTQAATCLENGVKTFTCLLCKVTRTETIAKLKEHSYDHGCDPDCNFCGASRFTSHSWDSRVTKEVTCAEEGIMTYICVICGEEKTEKMTLLAEHTWDSGKISKGATCKEEGICTYTCVVCMTTQTESIPKRSSHLYDDNCDPDCNDCGATREVAHDWFSCVLTEATCKEEGIMLYSCTRCSRSRQEAISKTEIHTYDDDCDTQCNVCGAIRSITHQYEGIWFSDTQAHWHECSICGAEDVKTAHTPGQEATEYVPQSCTVCGTVLTPALGHTHKWEETYSTNKEGHWYGCEGCDEREQEQAHSYDNGCDGTCDVCEYRRKTQHVPGPEASQTEDQVCTECGAVLVPATGPVTLPTEPEETKTPTEPDTPSLPTESGGTDVPAETSAPVGTGDPADSGEPGQPGGTNVPAETSAPTGSGNFTDSAEPGQPGGTEGADGPTDPEALDQSGANNNGGWVIALMVALLIAAAVILLLRKKKKAE